jgi:hypothetical protein
MTQEFLKQREKLTEEEHITFKSPKKFTIQVISLAISSSSS